MSDRKKRILVVNEFSQLNTGFSTYMYYLLPELYNSGKYEIAELATYIADTDPRIDDVPWKVYANEPSNPQERQAFVQSRENQFGRWKFDQVCLEFKPDIVITIRDPWMDNFIEKSPFRKFFHWLQMPTVDGEPQKEEWLEVYRTCDTIVTYTDWGKNLLEKQSGSDIKPKCWMGAPVDTKIFVPHEDKREARQAFGLEPDIFLIQTVMRNQPRKLYPDILKAFNFFLDQCREEGKENLAQKTYLYWHTSYPDVGWDIPSELVKHNLSHKVIFTYVCEETGMPFPSFFQGERGFSPFTKRKTARLPNTGGGVSRENLAHIMGLADVYIQYACSEGLGMPVNDAKACGVPAMVVEYSAMAEQAYNGGGIALPVERFYQESVNQTNQLRVLPDNKATGQIIFDFLNQTQEYRDNLSAEARECVEKYYTPEKVSEKWMNVIDEIRLSDPSETWYSPPNIIQPNLQIPDNLNNYDFVKFCYENILRDPEGFYSVLARKTISVLNQGYDITTDQEGRPQKVPFTRQQLAQNMLGFIEQKNKLEQYRYESLFGKSEKNKVRYTEI